MVLLGRRFFYFGEERIKDLGILVFFNLFEAIFVAAHLINVVGGSVVAFEENIKI
jgi:hypothetical protein